MFSISTIASSTRIPITRVRASSETMSRLNPASAMKANVGISETGIATAVTAVARQSRRKSQTTSAASAMLPDFIVSRVAAKPWRVESTCETILVMRTSLRIGGLPAAPNTMSCSAASTPSSVWTSLASLFLVT